MSNIYTKVNILPTDRAKLKRIAALTGEDMYEVLRRILTDEEIKREEDNQVSRREQEREK